MWKTSLIKNVISTTILAQMRQGEKQYCDSAERGQRKHIKKTG